MDKLNNFLQQSVSIAGHEITFYQILLVPTVLVVGYLLVVWFVRIISKRLAAKDVSPDVVHLLRRIAYVIGFALLFITLLELISVPLTAFAFVSGAVAIGVGFGAQNIINNFISGWILMWERPIRIGDFLEVGEDVGTVETINTRSTRIRRTDGVHMLIPNSALLENTVVNWTLIDNVTRTKVRVGVAYGSPTRKVAALIEQAVKENEDILGDPKPVVLFEDFGDSALIFDAYFWVSAIGEKDLRTVRSEIRFRVDELFAANDIVIAFPQQDVHIDGAIRIDSN